MGEFSIEIAGRVFGIHALFESTKYYCQAYLTEKRPDHAITVSREDLEKEQAELLAEALREGIRPRVFQEPFLERSVIQRKAAELLLPQNVLLLHGSTVAVDGEAYLFTANCGTGKSTHTRLWRQVFGDRAVMVNDDKPFLRVEENRVLACGSPWSGKHGLDSNVTVPLRGICILERGSENRIRRITPEEALPMLEKQSGAPEEAEHSRCRELAEKISILVPVWNMQCNKEPEAAMIAWEAMKNN